MRMKRVIAAIIALGLLAAACGDDATGSPSTTVTPTTTVPPATTTTPPADVNQRVLEVKYEGGFVPVEFIFNRIPAFTLFADGRLVYEGPMIEIFPGPLYPNVQVADIGVDGVTEVLRAIEASGLAEMTDEVDDSAADTVADASTTVMTYTDENGDDHIVSVYALGFDPANQLHQQLQAVIDLLSQLSVSGDPLGDYEPDRLQILVGVDNGESDDPLSSVAPWPLAASSSDAVELFEGLSCLIVEGDEVATVLPVLRESNQLTLFDESGTLYRLLPRPLLPGEAGCEALE
jgi:hypothetical protein